MEEIRNRFKHHNQRSNEKNIQFIKSQFFELNYRFKYSLFSDKLSRMFTFQKSDHPHHKLALITGSTTGIGKETALGLLIEGYDVIITGRDIDKGLRTLTELKTNKNVTGTVYFRQLDLCDGNSIKDFLNWFMSFEDFNSKKISRLICNAALSNFKKTITKDGFESNFQANVLGNVVLIQKLLPRMANGSRILTLSSQVIFHGSISDNFELTNRDYEQYSAYANSKLLLMFYSYELNLRLDTYNSDSIKVYSVHPGAVRTELMRDAGFFIKRVLPKFMMTPQVGARNSIYVSLKDYLPDEHYYVCQEPYLMPPEIKDDDLRFEIWNKLHEYADDLLENIEIKTD